MQTPVTVAPGAVPFGNASIIIDVRTGAELAESRLAKPHLHAPAGDLDPVKFAAEHNIAKDAQLYFLCRGGKRATTAAERFIAAGFENAYVIEGGIIACAAAGLPLHKGKAMSLERQVRIAAGALVVAGVALGATVSPLFYALPGFVGAGLVFAGITDTCGMAFVLARAPWNRNLVPAAGTACAIAGAMPATCVTPFVTVPSIAMPKGGITFYAPAEGTPSPVHVHALTKTGGNAGGCS